MQCRTVCTFWLSDGCIPHIYLQELGLLPIDSSFIQVKFIQIFIRNEIGNFDFLNKMEHVYQLTCCVVLLRQHALNINKVFLYWFLTFSIIVL